MCSDSSARPGCPNAGSPALPEEKGKPEESLTCRRGRRGSVLEAVVCASGVVSSSSSRAPAIYPADQLFSLQWWEKKPQLTTPSCELSVKISHSQSLASLGSLLL